MDLDKLKSDIINVIRSIAKFLNKILLPIILIIILICCFCYYLTIDDGVYKENDMSNAPYAVSTYTDSINIDENGQATSSMTAQELWDKMKENDNRGLYYLDLPEELLKLMNAELVTQFLDTRKNPDDPINWDSMNDINSKNIQGIVKLKRADASGNIFTMTYVDQETFQEYIDKYNSTGSEEDKKIALSHFTLESITTSAYDNITAEKIEEGDVINIPKGLGSKFLIEHWSNITNPSSNQYKFREKVGEKYDDKGYAVVNGRYVIACTTTFGSIGDYVDFYQSDGNIIPCVIGEIKNQNDSGCNKWGHYDGNNIIEFIVDNNIWSGSYDNPGTSFSHPEWGGKTIVKAVNGGSYYNKPDFSSSDKAEEKKTVNESNDSETMKWPTDSTEITSEFGKRSAPTEGASTNHKGVDIGVAEGTNVYACEAGKVTTASYSESAGNWVVIDHGNGYVSKYMHNKELKVSVGDKVEKGQVIALSGNTGHSTGPHLHFQIEYQGNAIDPMSLKYDNGQGSGTGGIGNDADSTDSSKTQYYAKVATWNEETNKIESNDPDVSSSEEITYNMATTNINYKEFLNCYTMPFDYLWALLVISENKNMVLELANLVYNSEIEITVHDNLTVTTDIVENTYTKKKKTDTSASVNVSYGTDVNNLSGSDSRNGSWTDEESNDYKIVNTVINKTNTLDISLTKANVWIVDYTQDYIYSKPDSTTVVTNEKLEDENYPSSPNATSNNDTYKHAQNLLLDLKKTYSSDYDFVSGYISTVNENIYNATVNKNKKTTDKIETEKYFSSPGNVKEKTDPNSKEDNFVTILRKNEYRNAKNNIMEVSSWLFEILEENDSTKDMVDLTKYLLNKVAGKDIFQNLDIDFESLYSPQNMSDISLINDFDVSDSSLFITDVNKLKKAFKGYSKSEKLIEHAQDFLDMQSKYNVNAVFAAAVSITETGAGNAGNAVKIATSSNSVGVPNGACWNNWFNIKETDSSKPYGIVKNKEGISHYKIYDTVLDSINNFGYNIAEGKYYYKVGKHTVDAIGHVYCPNSNAYPTQGDDWVKNTLNYINNFYAAAGIYLGSNAPTSGNSSEKLKYLFPKGIPTTQVECSQYMTTVSVPLTSKSGTKITGKITVHKSLAADVQSIFKTAQDGGFKIYEASGYDYRIMNNGTSNLSHHSYGAAIDINVRENYSHRGSKIYAGEFWNPSISEYSIPKNGVLVKAFEAKGWKWGGNWSGNYQDYMHFSYTGN